MQSAATTSTSSPPPQLTPDEIDDVLYLTRVNEAHELYQCLSTLAQKHHGGIRDVLDASLDPDSGNSVLHFAAANGFADLLSPLLRLLELASCAGTATATANATGATAAAARETSANPSSTSPSSASASTTLSQTHPLINRPNHNGNTPLHWAALNGHLDVVKLLIQAGANMWIKNAAGHLALFEAERAERNDVVQFLLEAGGKEVERVGVEGQPTAEDVVDVQESTNAADSSRQSNSADGGADVDLD